MKFDWSVFKNKKLISALIAAALLAFGGGAYAPLAGTAAETVCAVVGGCAE